MTNLPRYRGLRIDFYDNDLNFISGGTTRELLSVETTAVLNGIGSFSCTYPWPMGATPPYGSTLELVGNIVSFAYNDYNYGFGTDGNMRTLGEAYVIENIEVSNTAQGQIVRLSGRSLISELERILVWEPIGELHTYNTTLKIAVVGEIAKTITEPALQGDTEITLNSVVDVGETDMLEIPLIGGGTAYMIVSSIDGSVVTLTGGLPGGVADDTVIGVWTRKITPVSTEGMNVGSKLVLTLDSGTHTTIIETEPTEPDGGGDKYVVLRDPLPSAAAIGKAIAVYDRSEPATDDIAQIMANATGWTETETGFGNGSAHVPDGQSVLELLQAVAEIHQAPFRLALLPTTLLPTRSLVWGTANSGSTPGTTRIIIGNVPHPLVANYQVENRGIISGGVSNELRGPYYSRVYPTAGDDSVSLYGVSPSNAIDIEPFVVVNDPAVLGLYSDPYVYYPPLETAGFISAKIESFSHITAETTGIDAYMTASDMLAREAAGWLQKHNNGGYNWKARDVQIYSTAQLYVGQKVDIHYYDSSSQVRTTHNYYNRENLIVTEISASWDVSNGRPRIDLTLDSTAARPGDSSTRAAQKFRTYDRMVRRMAKGGLEGRSVVVRAVPTSPPPTDGGGTVTGSYLPLAGGTMTGNIAFSGTQTVDGVDISAHAANASAHHAPVTVGNTGLSLSGQQVSAAVKANGGLQISSGIGVLLPTNSGLSLSASGVAMGTPSTLTSTTTNALSASTHSHAITTTADGKTNPGTILRSSDTGALSLGFLGVGAAPTSTATVFVQSNNIDDYTLHLKQKTGQTADVWRVEGSAGDALIRLTGGGDLESGNPGFVSGQTGWQISATGDAEFNNAFIRGELHATTFVADEMHATGGTMVVMTAATVKDHPDYPGITNVLPGALGDGMMLTTQASWDGGTGYFSVGDIIRIKTMGEVTAGNSLDLYDIYYEVVYIYPVEYRNLNASVGDVNPGVFNTYGYWRRGGAAGFKIPEGSAAVKWGKVSGGAGTYTSGILLTSDLQYSPYMDMFTIDATKTGAYWQANDPTTFTRVHLRTGNLRGILGKSADEWGMAAGDDLSETDLTVAKYIVASSAGIELRNVGIKLYDSGNPTVDITAAGNVKFGTDTAGDTTTTFSFIASTGQLRIGPVGTGMPNLYWGGSALHLRQNMTPIISLGSDGSSYFAGPMTIGASGGIWQGTGTFASPTTGLKIWRDGSVGRLATYSGGTVQVCFDTAGTLLAGGGTVKVNANGLRVHGQNNTTSFNNVTADTKRITFYDENGSVEVGYIAGVYNTVTTAEGMRLATDANNYISFYDDAPWAKWVSAGSITLSTGTSTDDEYGGIHLDPRVNIYGSISHALKVATSADIPNVVFTGSGVDHGMTGIVTTNTNGLLKQADYNYGGVLLGGYTASYKGIILGAVATLVNTTEATTSVGTVSVETYKKSGAGAGSLAADDNIFVVRNNNATQFIVKGNGNFYYNGTGAAYDEHDDVGLLRALSREVWTGTIDDTWDKFVTHNRQHLIDAGVMSEGGFINGSALNRLLVGAIWQLHTRLEKAGV